MGSVPVDQSIFVVIQAFFAHYPALGEDGSFSAARSWQVPGRVQPDDARLQLQTRVKSTWSRSVH